MTSIDAPARPTEPTPPTVPGFTLGRKLGEGGFGVVYEATETGPAKIKRAVKLFQPSGFNLSTVIDARFRREAAALATLKHPSVVTYVRADYTDDRTAYLVMELVEGASLSKAATTMAVPEKVEAVAAVLDGLQHCHDHDIIHRDVKPSNIVVRADGRAVLVDFGLAFIFEPTAQDLTSRAPGTNGYVPDEVLADPKLRSPKHDIFACGVSLYEVFAGQRPVPSAYKPLASYDPAWAPLDRLVQKALAPAAQRYSTAAAFASDLRGALGRRTQRARVARNAAVGLGVLACCVLALVAFKMTATGPVAPAASPGTTLAGTVDAARGAQAPIQDDGTVRAVEVGLYIEGPVGVRIPVGSRQWSTPPTLDFFEGDGKAHRLAGRDTFEVVAASSDTIQVRVWFKSLDGTITGRAITDVGTFAGVTTDLRRALAEAGVDLSKERAVMTVFVEVNGVTVVRTMSTDDVPGRLASGPFSLDLRRALRSAPYAYEAARSLGPTDFPVGTFLVETENDFDDPLNALRGMIKPIKMPIPWLVTVKTRELRSGQAATITGQTPEGAIKVLQSQLLAKRYPLVVTILGEGMAMGASRAVHGEPPPAPTVGQVPATPAATPAPSPFAAERIMTLVVEVGMVGSLNDGAELPPAEVSFTPGGEGSNGMLVGPKVSARLKFDSPVRFLPAARDVVVRNRFVLESGSGLIGKPVTALTALETLEVPIVTVVYGKAINRIKGLDVNLIVNGSDVWQTHVAYDVPFQRGPRFKLPLAGLHAVLNGEKP